MSNKKNAISYEDELNDDFQGIENQYLSIYINDFVKKLRLFNHDKLKISISGLKRFVNDGDIVLTTLVNHLKANDIEIVIEGTLDSINFLEITANNLSDNRSHSFTYQVQNIPNIIELSSKTDIPAVGIIMMKIVAQVINNVKILYKAIVLDLDDTLWKGILSEDGIEKINDNMLSIEGHPFIEFMRFVRNLGNELGLFIAICSRNDSNIVELALDKINEDIFPLKNQIDFIIANNNDKSENIKLIAEQLSILPSSIVFIDDNQIVRDEVKNKMTDVFVPEWDKHSELVTKLIVGCVFERFELSLNSQNRRKQYRIINSERSRNSLPKLSVKINIDENHSEAIKLYAKSNQFKFSDSDNNFSAESKSLFFELIRENGDNLGICSAITYQFSENTLLVVNWALSCRYFEIGLEEFILSYMHQVANSNNIIFNYRKTDYNHKVAELIKKYSFEIEPNKQSNLVELNITNEVAERINGNTNLKPF